MKHRIFVSQETLRQSRNRPHRILEAKLDNSLQSKVIACQDGGEMYKTRQSNPTRDDKLGNLSQNPPADICRFNDYCNVRITIGREICYIERTKTCRAYKFYEKYKDFDNGKYLGI